MIAPLPGGIANTLITLCLWYTLALLGFRNAPRELRLSFFMLPAFLIIMMIFGKLNEVRLFDPFIPVSIGLIMCFLKSFFERISDSAQGAV